MLTPDQSRNTDQQSRARSEVLVRLTPPNLPSCTAVLSTSSVASLFISGGISPDSPLVWPLVVLALGSMAYDLGRRALQRRG